MGDKATRLKRGEGVVLWAVINWSDSEVVHLFVGGERLKLSRDAFNTAQALAGPSPTTPEGD